MNRTPLSVKTLILLTCILSILSPIVTMILYHFFNLPGPNILLSLSRYGILQGWLWQPFTYFLIGSTSAYITLGLLFSLFFYMFILWFTSLEIIALYGNRFFLLFYFSSAIIPAFFALCAQLILHSSEILVGSTAPILALLTLWGMLYPDRIIYLFLLLRMRAKMLVAILVGITLFGNLSSLQWIALFANLVAIGWALLIWKIKRRI